jgi:hypothetical protein
MEHATGEADICSVELLLCSKEPPVSPILSQINPFTPLHPIYLTQNFSFIS